MRKYPVLILTTLSLVLLACMCPLTQWITPAKSPLDEEPTESLVPSAENTPASAPTPTAAAKPSAAVTASPPPVSFDFTEAEDVWIYRANNERTGHYQGSGPVEPPELAWSFQTGGAIYSAPALVDGVAYFGSDDGTIYAVDLTRGQTLWTYPTGGAVRSSPALVDGTLYFGSDDGSLVALDPAAGELRWSFAAGGPVVSSPAVADGLVYFGSDDGYLYALDAATGQPAWQFEVEGIVDDETGIHKTVRSSPAVADGTVLFSSAQMGGASADLFFYALDSQTGEKRWESMGMNRLTTAAVWEGTTYFGGFESFGLEIESGSPVLSHSTEIVAAEPAVVDGLALYTTEDGYLVALDALAAEEAWSYETGSWYLNAPSVAGSAVYLTSGDGFIMAFDLLGGSPLWRVDTDVGITTPPVIYSGLVFVGTEDGRLLAFQ